MAVKNSGTSLSFKDDIEKEFGENDTRSLGGYQVQSGGSNFPLDLGGGLQFSSIDDGIPGTGEIKFSDFYSKKLNVVVDFYTGVEEFQKNAKTRYGNNNKVLIVGGYGDKPSSTSGKKVYIFVNKSLGAKTNPSSQYEVALKTGNWDSNTDLIVRVGTGGKIRGAGGKGGKGKKDAAGEDGTRGSSALGITYSGTTVTNFGKIQAGYGGGGGGAGNGADVKTGKKSSVYETSSGGGGGGGAGNPVGPKGTSEQGATSNGGDGGDGTKNNGGALGGGGTNAGAGGKGGGLDTDVNAAKAPDGGASSKYAKGNGGDNGYAIVTSHSSNPVITGTAVQGRIKKNQTPS